MAKKIKTKEKVIEMKSKGSVGKAADRAKIISVKAKDGAVEAKDKVQEKSDLTDERSPEQVTQKSIPIVTVTTDEDGISIKKTTYELKKVLTITIGHLSADEICGFITSTQSKKQCLRSFSVTNTPICGMRS